MYINPNFNDVTGGVSGSGKKWTSTYRYPHNLSTDEQDAVDMEGLSDVVRMTQPPGIAFRNVDVRFTEWHPFNENDVIVRIESSAELPKECLEQIMVNMNDYMQESLENYVEKEASVTKQEPDWAKNQMPDLNAELSKLDEAIESYAAFEAGDKLFNDLKTAAVYEIPFYLRYPISEYPGRTIEQAEEWLNYDNDQTDSLAFGFMDNIMDEDFDYSDELREAVGNGLIKSFVYKFDDDQSGKLYVEATRQLTEEEQGVMQDWLKELHYQGLGDLSECFNVFLDHERIIDVWNTWDDADRQTTFEPHEISLEDYLSRTQFEEDDFADAVAAISTEDAGLSQ